jgi:hypothetical protein
MVPRPPRTFFQALSRPAKQKRAHHPDPFNPKTTKGWANALKVRSGLLYRYECLVNVCCDDDEQDTDVCANRVLGYALMYTTMMNSTPCVAVAKTRCAAH